MMARNRRYGNGRQAVTKTRAGLAAAIVAGGGAIAVAAVAAGHSAGVTAAPAAYGTRFSNEGATLSSALADWGSARASTYSQLAQLTSVRGYSQAWHHGRTLDIQRGIVVLATNRFIVLQSASGSAHLWLVSAGTKFRDVSHTAAGTAALTGSTSATQQATQSGNMVPATALLAGSTTTAAAMQAPTPATQTVSVQVANTDLTVTVTVTGSTATVAQTATTPANARPAPSPSTYTLDAWHATSALARGDLAVIVGTRSHWTLHAQLVLFTPLPAGASGGQSSPAATPTAAATHW